MVVRNLALQLALAASLVSACSSRTQEPTQTVFLPPSMSPLPLVTAPASTSEPEEIHPQPEPSLVTEPTWTPSPPETLATQALEPAVVATVTSVLYPSPWMTYVDEDHGFQVDYPDGFEIGMGTLPYLSDSNLLVSFRFLESPQYASFEYNDDVVDAYVEVRAYQLDEFDQEALAHATSVKMGRNIFRNLKAGDNSMGGRYSVYDYYYIEHGDIVYSVALTLYGDGPGAGANDGMGPLPEEYASPGAREAFYFVLELMVASLQFQS